MPVLFCISENHAFDAWLVFPLRPAEMAFQSLSAQGVAFS